MAKGSRTMWDESASAAANARRKLPALAQAYFLEGRKVARSKDSDGALHRFRLMTKHLRYTLEFFRACYGPGLEERLERLRKIQEYLGDVSDCDASRALVRRKLPARSQEGTAIESFLRRRAQQKAAQFRRYWRREVDALGEDLRWRNYLARVPETKR